MKKLLLIRHAHAGSHSITDFERPLTQDGLKDAKWAGKELKEKGFVPQALITSPALRAKTTAGVIADKLGLPVPATNQDIYDASEKTLLRVINELPGQFNFIALTGHNPAISQLIYYLTGTMHDLPTCAMALLTFEFDNWGLLSADTGRLEWYTHPD
jgi:phosphohistidine phosphatase